MAEGAALEMLCTPKGYRGFKSHPLRQFIVSFLMSYNAFVQSKFLRTIATFSSFVFISLVLINPDIYSGLVKQKTNVSADFLTNDYVTDTYVVD